MSLECLLEAAKIVEQRENGKLNVCYCKERKYIRKMWWKLQREKRVEPCDLTIKKISLFLENHLQYLPIGRKDRKFVKRSQTYRYVY